jgi:hypothetical protein
MKGRPNRRGSDQKPCAFFERVMKVKNRMFCEKMIQRSKQKDGVSENKRERKRKRKRKQAPKLPEASQ